MRKMNRADLISGEFIAGIAAWLLLFLLGIHSGEPGLNFMKTILYAAFACMIAGNNIIGRVASTALGLISVLISFADIHPMLEFLLDILLVICGFSIADSVSEAESAERERKRNERPVREEAHKASAVQRGAHREAHARESMHAAAPARAASEPHRWEDCNHLHPFSERYSFIPGKSIEIRRGILEQTVIRIPIQKIYFKIHRSASQHLFGLCDVSFMNSDNGNPHGEEVLRNIRYSSAVSLLDSL